MFKSSQVLGLAQRINKSQTPIERLILRFPTKDWNWYQLSNSPNVTMDFVMAHPDLPWNWNGLSDHPNMTMELVMAHPDKDWSWYWLSRNPNVTMDFVTAHIGKDWDWFGLSCNKFTFEIKANEIALQKKAWRKIYYDCILPYLDRPERMGSLIEIEAMHLLASL